MIYLSANKAGFFAGKKTLSLFTENYFMSLSTLPIRSATSGSGMSSGACMALRYMKLFHAPYAMMIAALMARNFARLIVSGCTLMDRVPHNPHLLNTGVGSTLPAMYATKSSSISARSSRHCLQTSDAMDNPQEMQFPYTSANKAAFFRQ